MVEEKIRPKFRKQAAHFFPQILNGVDGIKTKKPSSTVGSPIIAVNMKHIGQQKSVGIACIEQNERICSIIEFDDNDFYSELEATVVLLGPKEALLPSIDGEFSRIKTLLERNNVMITVRKKTDFSEKKADLIKELNNLHLNAIILPALTKTLAISSLSAAIKYLDWVSDACNLDHFTIKWLNLNRFVHLDAAAVSALNLLPKPGTATNSPAYKWQSILGVLDRCQTPQGHRLMAQWIKQPLRDEQLIQDRHNIVQCFVAESTARSDLYNDYLKQMPDVLMLCKKLLRKHATLQDIYRLYQVVIRMPKLLSVLQDLKCITVNSVICDPIKDVLKELAMYKQTVEQIINIDGIEGGEFLIKASFDDRLEELKSKLDTFKSKIKKQLSKTRNDLCLDSVKLEYVSHLGHHFRIEMKDDGCLRKNNNYRILDAIKGGVRFTTERLSDLNEEILRAKEEYEEQQNKIAIEVIGIGIGYFGSFRRLNGCIAELDCLLSFAIAAVSAPIPYVKPKMCGIDSRVLKLTGLRHPCLELREDITFIANDVTFKQNETNMFIITGQKMGGKSTYIMSVAAAVLMAHVGSFVACDKAEISYVDSILFHKGADDNISNGLSTFMVEMNEIAGIIRTATEKSLVVIDELGPGKSTAWAISEHLAKETKCFTLFATQFHEITDLVNTIDTVKNSHMAAISDEDTSTLLYQVRPGVMDKSFGIDVLKLADFPEDVVQIIQKKYDKSEDHYSQLKFQEDEKAEKIFSDAIDSLTAVDQNSTSDAETNKNVKASNNEYFKKAFPDVLT